MPRNLDKNEKTTDINSSLSLIPDEMLGTENKASTASYSTSWSASCNRQDESVPPDKRFSTSNTNGSSNNADDLQISSATWVPRSPRGLVWCRLLARFGWCDSAPITLAPAVFVTILSVLRGTLPFLVTEDQTFKH